jgi:DNA-binding CsgD family transcriptional regulator
MIPVAEPITFEAPTQHTEPPPRASVGGDLAALLQHFDCGVVILDAEGGVLASNEFAQQFFGDGLFVAGNRLRVSSPNSQMDLEAALCAAALGPEHEVRSISLRRPSGERPLILRLQPLPCDDRAMARRGTVLALLFVAGRHIADHACDESLRALGLTRAEAEVGALLGAGFNPREVAERLNIKIATVRAHLKRIFQKLGLRRQTELVQLVTRLSFIR